MADKDDKKEKIGVAYDADSVTAAEQFLRHEKSMNKEMEDLPSGDEILLNWSRPEVIKERIKKLEEQNRKLISENNKLLDKAQKEIYDPLAGKTKIVYYKDLYEESVLELDKVSMLVYNLNYNTIILTHNTLNVGNLLNEVTKN